MISNCVHGVKYAVVGKDGVMEWKSQAGLLYADDLCLMVSSEEDRKVIMEKVNECVVEYKSRWWARCNHVCDKFGLWELVNLLWLRRITIINEGMAMLGMEYDRNVWKKTFVARIQEYGRRWWRNGFSINEREQQYVHMKSQPKNEKYANGSVGAKVRLMVRGGCL